MYCHKNMYTESWKYWKNTSLFLYEKMNASLSSLLMHFLVSVSDSNSSSIFTSMPKFPVAATIGGIRDEGSDFYIHTADLSKLMWSMESPGGWNKIHDIHLQLMLEHAWQKRQEVRRSWWKGSRHRREVRILVGAEGGSDDDLCALA